MILHTSHGTKKKRKQKPRNKRKKAKRKKKQSAGTTKTPYFYTPAGNNGNGRNGSYTKKEKSSGSILPRIAPWKIIVSSFLIGILGLLYLTHVFQTQKLLKEVKQLEHEYEQTKRIHEEYELRYERMTGPSEIYEKAKSHGFINGGPVKKIITIDQ